jgi:hypothetical protein
MKSLLIRVWVFLLVFFVTVGFGPATVGINAKSAQNHSASAGDCTNPLLCPPPWGAIDHIQNGGFNNYSMNSKIPIGWRAQNFSTLDGKTTTVKSEGTASIRIIGEAGKTKNIRQAINLDGSVGEIYTFGFMVKGKSIPTTGVCRVQVLFYNGSIKVETKTIKCPTGTFSFTDKYLQFTSQAAHNRIVVIITYRNSSGTVWFDELKLSK